MKITPGILSIPPYVSTPWKNISSMHTALQSEDRFDLIILLKDNTRIVVPSLDKSSIDAIFEAHTRFSCSQENPQFFSLPITGSGADLSSTIQHNPSQSQAPNLPKELLDKIAKMARALNPDDAAQFPKPEPHCNCPFCQVARALHGSDAQEDILDEEISEKDLSFRSWNIQKSADKLYTVSNPLDTHEHYSVYLGEPLGCTCGRKNCEHIRAVLND